jgi:hypothetical protein
VQNVTSRALSLRRRSNSGSRGSAPTEIWLLSTQRGKEVRRPTTVLHCLGCTPPLCVPTQHSEDGRGYCSPTQCNTISTVESICAPRAPRRYKVGIWLPVRQTTFSTKTLLVRPPSFWTFHSFQYPLHSLTGFFCKSLGRRSFPAFYTRFSFPGI